MAAVGEATTTTGGTGPETLGPAWLVMHILQRIDDLRQEQGNLRQEVSKEAGNLRQEISREVGSLRQEIGNLRQEVGKEIAGLRKDMEEKINRLEDRVVAFHRQAVWTFLGVMATLVTIWLRH